MKDIIIKASEDYNLEIDLLIGLILQESLGQENAVRYEPAFYKRYLQNKKRSQIAGYWPLGTIPNNNTEYNLRSTSFGLMQIMGQVAREYQFTNRWLTDLLNPEINIMLGARILNDYITKRGNPTAGLLRYNGGGDPDYPSKVYNWVGTKEDVKLKNKWGL